MRAAVLALAAGMALAGCSWLPPPPRVPRPGEIVEALRWGYPVEPEALAGLPDVTDRLSGAERDDIANHLRGCFSEDPVGAGYRGTDFAETLTIAFDGEGVTQDVAAEPGVWLLRERSPRWTFVRHAVLAAKTSRCSKLPLPVAVLGAPGRVTIRFTP